MPSLLFLEGYASQADIVRSALREFGDSFDILASHREDRLDILHQATSHFKQPEYGSELVDWIAELVAERDVKLIHAGKNSEWYERHRREIAGEGVQLVTGSTELKSLLLANHKYRFFEAMQQHGLPVVPSLLVNRANFDTVLNDAFERFPFEGWSGPLCIKPTQGVYADGFWILNAGTSRHSLIDMPGTKLINASLYREWLRAKDATGVDFELVLMPFLPGPEHSIDLVLHKGEIVNAVSRCKEANLQTLQSSGPAVELAMSCARYLNGDGLINVQTRNGPDGQPVLLEANMRPSGGVGYSLAAGVDLSADMIASALGLKRPVVPLKGDARVATATRAELIEQR